VITDHAYRDLGNSGTQSTGRYKGIGPGQCAWLGTCKQPADAHERRVRQPRRRSRQPQTTGPAPAARTNEEQEQG